MKCDSSIAEEGIAYGGSMLQDRISSNYHYVQLRLASYRSESPIRSLQAASLRKAVEGGTAADPALVAAMRLVQDYVKLLEVQIPVEEADDKSVREGEALTTECQPNITLSLLSLASRSCRETSQPSVRWMMQRVSSKARAAEGNDSCSEESD